MIRVVVEYRGDFIELPGGESFIGRGLNCAIRFNDASVSRRHLRFLVDDNTVCVEDLGSTNGSILNGNPIKKITKLKNGDIIQIGHRRLNVKITEVSEVDPLDDEDTVNRGLRWKDGSTARSFTTQFSPLTGSDGFITPSPTQHTCPQCRKFIPIEQEQCSSCGYQWPSGRSTSTTQRIKLDPASRAKFSLASIDRRQDPRMPVQIPVIYSSGTLSFEAEARDLSRGGIYIASELLDELETECTVTLLPDGAAAMSFPGVVRHVVEADGSQGGRPPGIGIQFTEISDQNRKWLLGLLEAHGYA